MLTRDAILAQMTRRTKVEPSAVFGGDVTIRELLRSEYRAAQTYADTGAPQETERILHLRNAVRLWVARYLETLSGEAVSDLGDVLDAAPVRLLDTDRMNAAVFAAAVIDDKGAPLFTADEILAWPQRTELPGEVFRIAQAALDLSEVGPDFLPPPSSDSPATPDAILSTAAS